jgi:hypothetical protein
VGQKCEFCAGIYERKISVGREPPCREDLSPQAEEYTLLEVVTRQLLVKTLQARKDLA